MTNELKCPVCGEVLDRHEEYLGHIDNNPKECCIEGYWTELQLEQIVSAKAAAVQQERERVVREVLTVANSVSMPYKSYLVIKDVLNNIKDNFT